MVNATPIVPMSNMISDAEWLDFPTSAIFRSPPSNLIPFSSFVSKGLYIPPTIPQAPPAPQSFDKTDVPEQAEDEDDILDAPIETDGDHQPTMSLKVIHDPNSTRFGRSTNAMVEKVSTADAWKLGKEGVEWAEPKGTSRGEFKSDKPPFHRALRALTQFFNSRSMALNKQHYWVAARFRNITRLRSCVLSPHLPGNYTPDPSHPMTEHEDEATGLIRDMEGTMRVYWRKVMEDAGKGWNYVMAMESFEIFNSFLHYLLFHNIFPEPWLHDSLISTCRLSRLALRQMTCASMIYDGTINTPTSFQMLAGSAWVGTEIDWEVAEKRVVENKNLGEHFGELRREVEAFGLEEAEKRKLDGEVVEVKEVKGEVVALDENWMHGENAGELIAALSKVDGLVKIVPLVAPHDATKITILKTIALSTCTVASVTTTSTLTIPTFLSILNTNKPTGFVEIKLSGPALADESGDPVIIIVDRANVSEEVLQDMIGMRIEARWTKVGLELGEGKETVGTWIATDLKRVAPCV